MRRLQTVRRTTADPHLDPHLDPPSAPQVSPNTPDSSPVLQTGSAETPERETTRESVGLKKIVILKNVYSKYVYFKIQMSEENKSDK